MKSDIKELIPGERAEILGYEDSAAPYRKKLLSMGLTTGAEIRLVQVAPLGDPIEIEVRGYKLSLRKEEAQSLKVRRVK